MRGYEEVTCITQKGLYFLRQLSSFINLPIPCTCIYDGCLAVQMYISKSQCCSSAEQARWLAKLLLFLFKVWSPKSSARGRHLPLACPTAAQLVFTTSKWAPSSGRCSNKHQQQQPNNKISDLQNKIRVLATKISAVSESESVRWQIRILSFDLKTKGHFKKRPSHLQFILDSVSEKLVTGDCDFKGHHQRPLRDCWLN